MQRGSHLESYHLRRNEHFEGNKVTRCYKLQAFTSCSHAHKHLHNLLAPTDVADEDFEAIFLRTGVHKRKYKTFHFHNYVTTPTPCSSNANSAVSAAARWFVSLSLYVVWYVISYRYVLHNISVFI